MPMTITRTTLRGVVHGATVILTLRATAAGNLTGKAVNTTRTWMRQDQKGRRDPKEFQLRRSGRASRFGRMPWPEFLRAGVNGATDDIYEYAYSEDLQAHLQAHADTVGAAEAVEAESNRRARLRRGYASTAKDQAYKDKREAQFALNSAINEGDDGLKVLLEAVDKARLSRIQYDKLAAEAWDLWPVDLDVPCPGGTP